MTDKVMITKNFSQDELSCPCCKVYGMKPLFVDMLQALRDHFGRPMVINSAYRCEKHNAELKDSAPDSQHLLGLAVDVAMVDSSERFELIEMALSLGFRGIGIGKNFVHIDFRASIPRIWTYPI